MLDLASRKRLIVGLADATRKGTLNWTSKEPADNGIGVYVQSVAKLLSPSRAFSSTTKTAVYEISSADSAGRAPFELRVSEFHGMRLVPIDSIKSTTNVGNAGSYEVNLALEALFKVVNDSVESGAEVVERLLRDLGEN